MANTEITKRRFDSADPNAAAVVRDVILTRLRLDTNFTQIGAVESTWEQRYVDFATERDREPFGMSLLDSFWQLIIQGVIAPGANTSNPNLPHFHLTEYGRRAIAELDYSPHDPAAYLRQLGKEVANPDATVLAYLKESLNAFEHGAIVASTMMLGIAAERVFLLVCDSLRASLADAKEEADFNKILDKNPVKPKLDWLADKLRRIPTPKRPTGFPDDADIQLSGICNLIRCQRNDVGHPREAPPTVTRDQALGYLRLFPAYYATAEAMREFLTQNKV